MQDGRYDAISNTVLRRPQKTGFGYRMLAFGHGNKAKRKRKRKRRTTDH